MMAAEVEVVPAYNDRHSAVGAHGYEEECCVLQIRPLLDGEQDAEASYGDGDGDQCECESMFCLVREVGYQHGEEEGAGPRRNAVKLRANRSVPVTLDYSGGKECVTMQVD